MRHLHSPCLLVTSHAAQFFPTVFQPLNGVGMAIKAQPTGTASIAPAQCQSVALGIPLEGGETCQDTHPQPLSPILFDGVLCDAPCSGDGTLRKSRFLWASWSPHQGLGCHRLQLQILLRCVRRCYMYYRRLYSCSMNLWRDSFAVTLVRASLFPHCKD